MERAFIKGLRQVLSKKFQYRIVADRGFGNQRFINLCQENNFGYVIRVNKNLRVKDSENNQKNLQEFDKTNLKNLELYVNIWDQNIIIETATSNDSTWFLVKSSMELNGKEIYEKRFKIEKLFQDNDTILTSKLRFYASSFWLKIFHKISSYILIWIDFMVNFFLKNILPKNPNFEVKMV